MSDKRVPVSPIHGCVTTTGSATPRGPFIQLANPAGSGIYLVVYELMIGCLTASTGRARARRTASPLPPAATVTTAGVFRLDERDATAIVATLKGSTNTDTTAFTEALSFWFDRITKNNDAGYQMTRLIQPLAYPLIVAPGSALELMHVDTGTAVTLTAYMKWDELVSP
jgi:hypothetical protein